MTPNPYELKLAEIQTDNARLRVESLIMARKFIDDKLRSAKLELKLAEERLISKRQLRMFDNVP